MTWIQTASGRAFDLLNPRVEDIDFAEDISAPLARIARFGGHVGSGPYSVAQHCVVGCDAFVEAGRHDLAAAFLLHDAHEAPLGDFASPVSDAIERRIAVALRTITGMPGMDTAALGDTLWSVVWKGLKADIDRVIHAAAGIKPPRGNSLDAVKTMDLRMLRTERDQLLGKPPQRWHVAIEAAEPVRLKGKLTVWPWPRAADEWMQRLKTYCPHAAGL